MANTSITVTFVTDTEDVEENASIQVQLDSERNDDETIFLYGSKAYYQVLFSPSSLTISQIASDGEITEEGSGITEFTEYVIFSNSDEGSAQYPVSSVVSAEWQGDGLGALSYTGKIVKASKSGVGVLKLTYNAAFNRYAISVSDREETEYYVVVYITGTHTDE
jgi:hypothetical protein